MDARFSIVMPAYNVEKYVQQAIKSIINQTYTNWELIIIDDGSTDNTWQIIKEFKSDKIKPIHTENGGVSKARNIALSHCSGDYVMFLDGDDYYENWTLKKINTLLKENPDTEVILGTFNCKREDSDLNWVASEILIRNKLKDKSQEDVLEYLYNIRLIHTVWRFAVKKSLIDNNNLTFVEGILHEDEDWVTRMLICANKFDCITKPFYNYRLRKNSIMTSCDYSFLKKKNDSKYRNASLFLDMAEKTDKEYIKTFLYRCAYKNTYQIYSAIKRKANPSPAKGRWRDEI